jgi:polyhydroxyalkanoate synthesis regulator phasin
VDELERDRVQNALSKEANRCRSLAAERLAELTALRQHLAQLTEQMQQQQV